MLVFSHSRHWISPATSKPHLYTTNSFMCNISQDTLTLTHSLTHSHSHTHTHTHIHTEKLGKQKSSHFVTTAEMFENEF